MKRRFYSWMQSAQPIAAGLATAHLIATFFVWQSNHRLFSSMEAIIAAGWQPLPAGAAAQSLISMSAAMWGGLFFTLSVGTGLTLATWAALNLRYRFFRQSRFALSVMAGCWLVLFVWINSSGWVPFPTMFTLFVPLVTAWTTAKSIKANRSDRNPRLWLVPVMVLALLTGLWATQLNKGLFIAIRDRLLLSNPVGLAVNDFYYRNTLYAAQAFKSFGQKTLRTCRITDAVDDRLAKRLVPLLARYDVLAAPQSQIPDLVVDQLGDLLVLVCPKGNRLEVEPSAFTSDPNPWLLKFSTSTDRQAPFRRLTLVALLLGFPILLYVSVYGLIRMAARAILADPQATWAASGLCFIIGMLLFLPMLAGLPVKVDNDQLGAALTAERWPPTVAALRQIESQQLEIANFPEYRGLINSPHVVVRYYLARGLAMSRNPATATDLLDLIRDNHTNVICQAYYALGRRGNPKAIEPIWEQMLATDHWYTQWYGYRAIRRLGWQQTQLK